MARRTGKGALVAPCPRERPYVGTLRFAHPTDHGLMPHENAFQGETP
jgi:hypothetical protein